MIKNAKLKFFQGSETHQTKFCNLMKFQAKYLIKQQKYLNNHKTRMHIKLIE